ncbi:MAG: hypothetical protein ABH811_01905 [archaeon]
MEEEKIFRKEELIFINQLIKALEEAEPRLEEAYEKKDYELLNQLRKFILQAQNKIDEVVS